MAARKLRNRWWVDFRHNFVRYRKKSPVNTRAGAQVYEATLRGRLARGEDINSRRVEVKSKTFEQFAWEWFETYVKANNKPSEQVSKATILRNRLVPHFGRSTLDCINVEAVERFKGRFLSTGLSPKTVNNALAVLRKCLASAVDWGQLVAAPTVRPIRTAPSETDYLSEAEADRLREVAVAEPRRFSMVLAAIDTGMRLGELRALRWDDIDFDDRVIIVSRAFARDVESSTKSNRIRAIPLTPRLRAALESLPRGRDRVFPGVNLPVMSEDAASTLITKTCQAAGIRRIPWHRLRHTFATRLVRRGNALRAVQTLLGHSTVAMTERYTHVAPAHLFDVIASLETRITDNRSWATSGQQRSTVVGPSRDADIARTRN